MTAAATRAEINSAVWDRIEAGLASDPYGEDFNTAHESCARYCGEPHRLALTVCHEDGTTERWTYLELDRYAAKTARVLADLGLRRGDRVAGLLSRQVESWITALAAWRSGLVYVPLFGGFAADALGLRLRTAGAKAVVVDAAYRLELAAAQNNHHLDIDALVVGAVRGRAHRGAASSHMVPGDVDFWSAIEAASDGPQRVTAITDTATLLFTSGTSGTPKACVMTHAAFLSVIPFAQSVLGLSSDTGGGVFSTADPAWAFGLYTTGTAVMALGVPRVIYSGPFQPQAWHRVTVETKASVLATAPSAIRRLAPVFSEVGIPQTLRTVAAAGEPLTAAAANSWDLTGAPTVRNGYGLSEVGMVLGDAVAPGPTARPGMLTHLIPGFDAFLVTADGSPVAAGESGLVAVRRPRHQMSAGYENAPELWRKRWYGEVFVTEDRAHIDGEGRWMIEGRADDMIITSGHNVSPVEVENAILKHPAIAEAAAVAHADDARGDVVRAVVVAAPQPRLDADELTRQLKDLVAHHVGKYASPRIVTFVDALPRNEVGKLRRASLRSQ